MKKKRKENKIRPWLRKPVEEKKVQDYYYVKAKHKEEAKKVIKETLKQFI